MTHGIAGLVQDFAQRERDGLEERIQAQLDLIREGSQQPVLLRGGYLGQVNYFRGPGQENPALAAA